MKGRKLSATDVLSFLADECLYTLHELGEVEKKGLLTDRQFGMRMQAVACLEILQQWEHADELGLDFNIENSFPV